MKLSDRLADRWQNLGAEEPQSLPTVAQVLVAVAGLALGGCVGVIIWIGGQSSSGTVSNTLAAVLLGTGAVVALIWITVAVVVRARLRRGGRQRP